MKRAGWPLAVAVLAALASQDPRVAALALLAALGVLAWRFPEPALEAAVWAVLVVRPSLDVFSERRYGLSLFVVSPAVALGVLVVITAAVLAVRRARVGRPVWTDPELRAPHLWLLAAYGIGLWSGLRWYGLGGAASGVREVVRVASIVAALLLVLWWVHGAPGRYRRGWAYLVAGMLVPLTVAFWQLATGRGNLEVEGINRLQGTFSNPNALAPYLVPFILVTIWGMPTARGFGRLVRIGAAGGLTVLLALTYSRTALIALGAGLTVLPVLQAARSGARGLLRGVGVVGLLGALGWVLVGGLIRERFSDVSLGSAPFAMARSGAWVDTFTWRLVNWNGLIRLGDRHPWTGHGAGMTTVLNPLVNEDGVPYNAHNDFVRFFFETGALGLICYLLYGLLLARWAWRRGRGGTSAARARTALAVTATWLALFFLTAGVTELSLQTALMYTLGGMLGLLDAPEVASDFTAQPAAVRRR